MPILYDLLWKRSRYNEKIQKQILKHIEYNYWSVIVYLGMTGMFHKYLNFFQAAEFHKNSENFGNS
ncbi:hypothetical protein [Chryseobacterium indoltheticum]|uniref:hypothetical protein n=1 Tax=Chryseobacterium indoltheticum TaxID=254 RepID=UPI003F49394C